MLSTDMTELMDMIKNLLVQTLLMYLLQKSLTVPNQMLQKTLMYPLQKSLTVPDQTTMVTNFLVDITSEFFPSSD